jgi:hypothetical protein
MWTRATESGGMTRPTFFSWSACDHLGFHDFGVAFAITPCHRLLEGFGRLRDACEIHVPMPKHDMQLPTGVDMHGQTIIGQERSHPRS